MGDQAGIGVTLPGGSPPAQAARLAAMAESVGCEAVWALDVRRDPYLLSAAAIGATSRVTVGTNVAVAFARSPTVTATAAWDLAGWSDGRFVLGLGSQVGPTLEARFGVTADHPAARMRDYVRAVRACFEAFRKGYGGYRGDFYTIRRPALQPGAQHLEQDPPIYIAAVNPFMTRVAGEVSDGLAAHPFSTEEHLARVLLPELEAGARQAGRPRPPVLLQLVVAPTRQVAAAQMLAYTVPAYRRVLDQSGLGEVADRVMAAAREGRRAQARDLIEHHLLDHLGVIVGDDEGSLRRGLERWRPYADRLSLSVPWFGMDDAEQFHGFESLLERLATLLKDAHAKSPTE
ncbi:MAG: LLM class flavin-dependent oxidoreductase [Candidatus Dormibacteraeota bacterium]|nr:LLM class flavin-dependent oxidoreductase [Candidatus Dormibacteraeota bacterium]